jgi:fibronectin-binding autotransporter adhesin
MADRFWVGGTGNWNTTTTSWSATSGGGGGASAPTVADSVFFDQAGTYTVTMSGALSCLDITVSAGTVTFATGASPTLNIRGSMTLLAGTVWSSTGSITFSSTTAGRTITTNGVSISGAVDIASVGGGGVWTLGSAFSNTGNSGFRVLAGTFNTGNYNLTTVTFGSSGSPGVRTVNLGSSTITCTQNSSNAFNLQGAVGLTFNAGTSTILITGITSGISVGTSSFTLNNVSFTNTTGSSRSLDGRITVNNLSVAASATAGVTTVTFSTFAGGVPSITVNGTLSTTGTAGNRRVFFTSDTGGIAQDLVINSAPSLTDADFRGLYVRGTAAPISGTRIGNRGECRGITFSTPKTVYWNLPAGGNWPDNAWATSIGGTVNTDNFPLPQDTGVIVNTGLNTSATIAPGSSTVPYISTIDMSARTNAMTFSFGAATTVYGNWITGSGVSYSGTQLATFSGGTTQTITSAGKTFTCPITIDNYGGTVQLADALNIGTQILTVTNGTFTTAGYAVTASSLRSAVGNVRSISFGASTLTLSDDGGTVIDFNTTNLTFNSGTSQINSSATIGGSVSNNGTTPLNLYNFSVTGTSGVNANVSGLINFNNLTINVAASANLNRLTFNANSTISGTLTCAGASAVRRIFLRSNTIGTPRTLTVNAISATDCDFRDINLAGAASGASPTRAGDCGGNTGITFPAPKTVYWNLAGAQDWSATAWATGSGGTPAINNFPLAQDTAVFDNAGSVTGTITIQRAWNIGTMDASNRTSAMTLFQVITTGDFSIVYGDWKFGTGVTLASTSGTINFSRNGTQTITSNGVQFGCNVTINHPLANVQLADALSLGSTRTLSLTAGTFDAVTYNVTTGLFNNGSTANTLRMGSGTWTLSGTSAVWNCATAPTLIAGTSTIVLSDTSTSGRIFNGGGLYYNKLTIGGATGTSTLTITGSNTFGELASTKTVAHTILFPINTTTTVGRWAITGTVGNAVTVNTEFAATAFNLFIAGPANSGIDYLSIRDCTVDAVSPGEFYVGANSTNVSGNTRVIFTATPAPRTLYWVGGTGNWSSTTKWDTTSGGGGGAAIPTSLDAVNFNSASNATAYTATVDAGVTLARCASFTMAGPASGNVTFAGTVGIAFHGNVSFAATGITRTYSGTINWAGNSSYTFTSNGLSFTNNIVVTGVGSTWTLGSTLTDSGASLTVTYGALDTSTYNLTCTISSSNTNKRTINLGSGTHVASISFSTPVTNLEFNAGTSTINTTIAGATFLGGSQTFYNVNFTSAVVTGTHQIIGVNTFNTLSFAGRTTVGITPVTFFDNQTINTLTLNAGTASAFRTFLRSNTIGTPRTLTIGTLTAGAADIDFRDITIAGAAAPISGTRFGDAKGNSGITFPAAKTVYWAQTSGVNWGSATSSWSLTNGGSADAAAFPLAQDTAFIPFARPNSGSTITVNDNYNIGTLDMNERNGSALVTLATSTNSPAIYGNFVNGSGVSYGTVAGITFSGRGSQTITSNGAAIAAPLIIDTPGGTVTLADALSGSANSLTLTRGTFDAASYNVTRTSFSSNNTNTRTIAVDSGTWTIATNGTSWNAATSTNLTVTGTGTISLTSPSAKTFAGGGISYSGITLNQGGAGALTITGNNTFKNITNTFSATGATSILLGNTTQTLTQPWTATGAAGRVLTISGTSAASPGTLIFTGAGQAANVDYLAINNVRAYDIFDEWYAGPNSTNGGSLGWYFVAAGGTVYAVFITESASGVDAVLAEVISTINGSVSEAASGIDAVSALGTFGSSVIESASGVDAVSALAALSSAVAESASGVDVVSALASLGSAVSEAASGVDAQSATITLASSIAESASAIDAVAGGAVFTPIILESASGIDEVLSSAQFGSAVAETAGGVDTFSSLASLGSAVSETASGVDAIASSPVYTQSIIEAASGVDAVSSAAVFTPVISETASGLDSISGFAGLDRTVSETATAVTSIDSIAVLGGTITETASGVDTTSALASLGSAVSETASGIDAITGIRALPGVISEAASGVDSTSVSPVFASSASEAASGIDAASVLTVLVSVASEAASGLDSNASTAVFTSSASEAASGIDAASSRTTFGGIVLETASGIDSTVGFISFPSSISETASGADAVSGAQTMVASAVEAASGVDAASSLISFGGVVSENSSGADAISARALFGSAISEASSGVDATASSAVQLSNVAETASGIDSLSAAATFPARVTETSSAQDDAQAAFLVAARINELSTGADQIAALRTRVGAIAESAVLYEGNIISTSYDTPGAGTYTVPSGVTTVVAALWGGGGGGGQGESTEDGGGGGSGAYARKATAVTPGQVLSFIVGSAGNGQTDFPLPVAPSTSGTASSYSTVSAGGGVRGVNGGGGAGGTATGGDVNLSGGNGVVTAGGIAPFASGSTPGGGGNGGVYAGIFNAPGGNGTVGRVRFSYASGTPTASVNFVGQAQEALSAQDSVNAPGSTYNAPVVELAQLLDSLAAQATFPSSVAETATGEETSSAAFIPLAAISESATATDVTSALAVFAAQTAESANITDEVSPPGSIYNPVVLAVATMLDSVNAPGSIYNPRVVESATIADSLIGAYLWNLIDNAENADWGTIDVAQVTSWGVIDAAQPADWQNVNSPQTPNWSDIDDSQTPNWQNINT